MKSKNSFKVIMPHGAMGADKHDDFIDGGLRAIGVAASTDPKMEWADKYGTDFENDVFMMHRYCWCEKETCKWCEGEEPNFRHKQSGLEITWYKYIGRGQNFKNMVSPAKFAGIVKECIESIDAL